MPYKPDCETNSRVSVNGTRLPVSSVDVYMRKEGPLDITRYAEFTFVSPFNGESFADVFKGLDSNSQDNWDVVKIEVLDNKTKKYNTEFSGMVTGVGSNSGPEKEYKVRAQGPGMFADKIPASFTAGANTTLVDIIQYATFKFAEKLPLVFPLGTNGNPKMPTDLSDVPAGVAAMLPTTVAAVAGIPADVLGITDWSIKKSFRETAARTLGQRFKRNKHTLADLLKWTGDKFNVRMFMIPFGGAATLVATDNPTGRSHKAQYLNGDTNVVSNDALVELNPVNTMVLNGKAGSSLFANTPFEVKEIKSPLSGNEYHTVKVRHSGLYQRAGKQEFLATPDQLSNARTKAGIKSEARSKLKRRIDETTGGDMTVMPTAPVRPFDTIKAKPTCDTSPATSTSVQTYEISRVHHQITGKSGASRTKLNVGIHTSRDDLDIVGEVETKTQ